MPRPRGPGSGLLSRATTLKTNHHSGQVEIHAGIIPVTPPNLPQTGHRISHFSKPGARHAQVQESTWVEMKDGTDMPVGRGNRIASKQDIRPVLIQNEKKRNFFSYGLLLTASGAQQLRGKSPSACRASCVCATTFWSLSHSSFACMM